MQIGYVDVTNYENPTDYDFQPVQSTDYQTTTEYDFQPVEAKDYDPSMEQNLETRMEDSNRDSRVYDSFPVPFKIYNEEDNSKRVSMQEDDDDSDEESWIQTECKVYEDVENTKM